MATRELVERTDVRALTGGVAAALVVVGGLTWVLFTRPTVGFFALIGAGVVGAAAVYLTVQERETVDSVQRDLGRDRHYAGSSGGAFGAWVGEASGAANARRHHIAVAVVSFSITLLMGSFATLLLAESVATWLGIAV